MSRKLARRPALKPSADKASAHSAAAAARQAPMACADPLSEWKGRRAAAPDRPPTGYRRVQALRIRACGHPGCSATNARDRRAATALCAPPLAPLHSMPRFRLPCFLPSPLSSVSAPARAMGRFLGTARKCIRRFCDRICVVLFTPSCSFATAHPGSGSFGPSVAQNSVVPRVTYDAVSMFSD